MAEGGGGAHPLLSVVLHEPDWIPELMVLCAGYELGAWRADALANEIFGWLPSFVLPWSERQQTLGSTTAVKQLRRAANVIYQTDKYDRRGEFGELILHGILCQEFGAEAAVSKFWLKDAANETVKGYDAIHITRSDEQQLHLWLGEAKFYSDLAKATQAVLDELELHLKQEYLKNEFMLVSNKIDPDAPFAEELRLLLDENTSLDEVFSVLHIPVLLTFNSQALADHTAHCDEYVEALTSEVEDCWGRFEEAVGSLEGSYEEVVLHLVLVPLLSKADLTTLLHEKLQAWQAI